MRVVSYGVDYVRFVLCDKNDARLVQGMFDYVDVPVRRYHGVLCADFSGDTIETIRMVEDIGETILSLSSRFVCSRVDVFIDVEGNIIDSAEKPGTCISNDGRIETAYSCKLTSRGNVPTFARMYDAREAGHYEHDVTRFECEYKLEKARSLLSYGKWARDPIAVALYDIKAIYNVSIEIEEKNATEFRAKKRSVRCNREKFYARYGAGIVRDIELYGVQGLYSIILSVLQGEKGASDNG